MANAGEPASSSSTPWDSRYSTDSYVYGTDVNEFVASSLEQAAVRAGARVVELACGEGRNAVYLARQGFQVTAVDSSRVGLEKTLTLAARHGVTVETVCADALAWRPEAPFDVLVTTWFHVHPDRKNDLFRAITNAMRPGGMLIAEWFHPDQRRKGFTSGGPPDPDMMFTKEELIDGLSGFSIDDIAHTERTLSEGSWHTGLASTVAVRATRS